MSSTAPAVSRPVRQAITPPTRFTLEEFHRGLAPQLFAKAGKLLDKPQRTVEEDDQMLALAYASLYHWSRVGGPQQQSVGHWQIARIYTKLLRLEPALYHARRALTIAEANQLSPFNIACGHQCLAHALALNKEFAAALEQIAATQQLLTQVSDPEDRKVVETDLAAIPRQ